MVKRIQQSMVKYLALATVWAHSHILKEPEEGQITQNPEGENSGEEAKTLGRGTQPLAGEEPE